MELSIHLLGAPKVIREGTTVPARGHKAWGLLAYLILSNVPRHRSHLSELLFANADDPLRALRWNLTELRQLLGQDILHGGDEIVLSLPPGSYVDVRLLVGGTWVEATSMQTLGQDLLEGMSFAGAPSFESWLLNERRHLAACSQAVLRESSLTRLASGDAQGAVDAAVRLVALDPLDEEHQSLLVRSYAAAGDREAAARQMAAYTELCRRELGAEPGPALSSALHVGPAAVAGSPIGGRAAAQAQLEAGLAAVKAGAKAAGIDCLRRATAEAHSSGDLELRADTMLALGSTLAHGGRQHHEEGAASLHGALEAARRMGSARRAAEAELELAWIEFMSARYERARLWLAEALTDGDGNEAVRCVALWIRGKCSVEVGRYADSLEDLGLASELAVGLGDGARRSFCYSSLARTHLLARDLVAARSALEAALETVRAEGFLWIASLPRAFLGEVEILEGNLDRAGELLEDAYASAREIGDASFESFAARGLGLLAAARGDTDSALTQLRSAVNRLVVQPDCVWAFAYALDALCSIAAPAGAPEARGWVEDLEAVAGRTGMREMLVHAYVYRHQLGEGDALDIATALATEIDNPSLPTFLRAEVEEPLVIR